MRSALDPEAIKSRIDQARGRYREAVLDGLITAEGAAGEASEAELQRLQDLDEQLRAENIELELLKQQIAQNLRDQKGEELKKISQDTEQELEALENEREKMLLEMDRKQSEIEVLQRDLSQAEQRLASPLPSGGLARPAGGIDAADRERQLVGLAHTHATVSARRAAQRDELLRSKAEIGTARRVPVSVDTGPPASPLCDSQKIASRNSTGSGARHSNKKTKNETLDELVSEAEALLRRHLYDNHDVLRRLDKSRNVPPGTAADSVNSLFAPEEPMGGDTVRTRDRLPSPSLPQVAAPRGYVSTRDTLDHWLTLKKDDSAPQTTVDLATALHLNGSYEHPMTGQARGEFSPDLVEKALVRSKSATSEKPSSSRTNQRSLRDRDAGSSIAVNTGKQTLSKASPRYHAESTPPATVLFQPDLDESGHHVHPPEYSSAHRYQPVARHREPHAAHPPDVGGGHMPYMQPNASQPPAIFEQNFHTRGAGAPPGQYVPFQSYPYGGGHVPPNQQAIYSAHPYQRDPYDSGRGHLPQFLPPRDTHHTPNRFIGDQYRARRRGSPDRGGHGLRDYQSDRPASPIEAGSKNNEVIAMKARMKALADELEAENAALQFKVSAAKGEPIWPAVAGAVRTGAFRPTDSPPADAPISEYREATNGEGTSDSRIMEGKNRIDEILSKQVDMNSISLIKGGSSRSRGGGSVVAAKERNNYETELLRMRLEMDMLRQKAALDELKDELELQRTQRLAETEHEKWLREKKHRLQAIRVQKALSTEQKLYEDEMAALGIAETDKYLSSPSKNKTNIVSPESPLQSSWRPENAGNVEFCVDGLIVPTATNFDGDAMRIVVGVVNAQDGTMIGRLLSSDWQPWTKSIQRGKSFKRTQSELKKLHSDADTADSSLASRIGSLGNVVALSGRALTRQISSNELELMESSFRPSGLASDGYIHFISKLRVLVEVQIRQGQQGIPKGAGWCTLDLSQASGGINMSGGDVAPPRSSRQGKWRLNLMTGVADPNYISDQRSGRVDENLELSATNSTWLLFRINHSESLRQSLINPVHQLLGQEGEAAWAAFMEYQNFSCIDAPPIQRTESVKSLHSSPSMRAIPQSPKDQININQSQDVVPPSTAGSTGRTDTRQGTARNKTPVSTKLAAGLDVLSAINEMKHLSAVHHDEEKESPSGFFDLGTPTGPAVEKYTKDDGIDVYIDGARFLPNNATVTRCVVKILSSDFEQISVNRSSPVVCGYSEVESDAMSPMYRMKAECRASVLNCMATLLFRIDTIDAATLQCVGVGYSALRVFCTKDRESILLPNDPNAFINTGKFQLPIFAGRVPTGGTFQDTVLADGMQRIPCASLLVRIVLAPKSADGLATLSCADVPENSWEDLKVMVPAPDYGLGQYDGRLCEPVGDELLCFSAKLGEKTIDHAGLGSVKGFLLRVLSTQESHKYPPAPEGPGVTSAELQQWANGLMPGHETISSVIDYSFTVPYSFEAGLEVNVLSLFNVPDPGIFSSKTMLFKAIFSMAPPAIFYHDSPHSEGVHFTADCDFESSARAPEFVDGYRLLYPTSVNAESYLVLDVRAILVEKGNKNDGPVVSVEPAGGKRSFWTLVPVSKDIVYGEGSHFISTGVYQVPLIEGSVPKSIIDSNKPMRALLAALSSPKTDPGHIRLSGASVLVMLQNPLLRNVLKQQHPELYPRGSRDGASGARPLFDSALVAQNLELYFVDKFCNAANACPGETHIPMEKLRYDPGKFYGVKVISSLLTKINDLKKLKKLINRHFAECTGLTDDAF